jgi:anti-anti-sigma regulatory factor
MQVETTEQRRIGLAIIGLLVVGICLVVVSQIAILAAPPSQIFGALVGLAVATGLLVAYWRGWAYARHVTVVFFTLLTVVGLPEPYVSNQVTYALLIPPVLALILLPPIWVAGSAVVIITGTLIRAQGRGVYSDAITLVLFGVVVGGMILARLVSDAAHRAAETQAQRAAEAQARAEQQATELAEANVLMNEQLDHQRTLLDLVTTLETPAVSLAEGVLFAPIVGHIDTRRAEQLTNRLLQDVSAHRARLVVLDITGVAVVDTSVARALLNMTQAIRLLGCDVTISGISASVAMTLTHIGIALDGVRTARSPQEALMQHLAMEVPSHGSNGDSRSHN